MEKIYTSDKIGKHWQKEARTTKGDLWWFDFDEYEDDMKLGGN